jgi:tight adherence protein B
MGALVLPVVAAVGVYYVYTALAFDWRGLSLAPTVRGREQRGAGVEQWLVQAGLGDIRVRDFAAVMAALFVFGTAVIYAVFGAILPALAVGAFAATFPLASYRVRRSNRRAAAQDAWPRLIEEIRILTASLGRSIPQALFEVGRRAPDDMRSAFEAAHREWLISTDFERTLSVLKAGLADPTADATCETLLVAHTVGGSDLDRRLEALAEDRIQDTQGRKDARAKQAGARFARRFVLFVPFGMAIAGMSVGDGREAFSSATGQFLTLVAVLLVIVCWSWAGRILRVPEEERVFFE